MNINRILPSTGTALLIVITLICAANPVVGDDNHLADRSKAVANDAKEVAVDASQSVATGAENLWNRIDEQGLANRTGDEIVAWMVMGGLVGGLAGMLTSMRSTGFGRLGRLLLGLTGAFVGGLVVRLGHFNLGWGSVLISYQELLFSFAGAVMLIILARLLRTKTRKGRA